MIIISSICTCMVTNIELGIEVAYLFYVPCVGDEVALHVFESIRFWPMISRTT